MYWDRPGATKGAKMSGRTESDYYWACFRLMESELVKLVEATQEPDLDEMFQEVRADARQLFMEGCMFRRMVNVEPDCALEFKSAVMTAIRERSRALASKEVHARTQAGEEISHENNFVAIMLRDRDNNTPDYQRRVALYELAKQVADRVA